MRNEVYQSMDYTVVGPNASFRSGHIIGSRVWEPEG